jgi:hypothetical protein
MEVASTGEAFSYKGHATSDGIWLLDSQSYAAPDQAFDIERTKVIPQRRPRFLWPRKGMCGAQGLG